MSPSARRFRSCTCKIAHPTRKEAWQHARRLGKGYKPYKCAYHDHHHVGRPTSDPILRGLRKQRSRNRFSGKQGRFKTAA